MKPIDYFNLPNKNKQESGLEHRISSTKKAGLTLAMIASLAPASLGLLSNPTYAAQRDDKKQELKVPSGVYTIEILDKNGKLVQRFLHADGEKEKRINVLVPFGGSLRIIYEDLQKTPQKAKARAQGTAQTQAKAYATESFTIGTLDARVGKEYLKLNDRDTLSIPYDMDFYLNPQTKKGLMTEFLIKLPEQNKILNEIYQTDDKGYVCDRFMNRVKITNQTMRFKDYGLEQGQRPILDCTYELPNRLFQTAQVFVQLLPGQEAEEQMIKQKAPVLAQAQAHGEIKKTGKPLTIQRQNPPNPQPVLDELKKDLVAEADLEREEKEKQKSRSPAVIIPKFAYVLNSENPDDAKAQRTGKGVFGELEYAKPNIHLWASALSQRYDDEILVLGGSTIENVFTDADLGFEAKTSSGFGLVGGINVKSTHKEWLPTRTPLFAPEMSNYDFKSVYAGIGAAMGDYDKSFIQGMIYGGYGKLVETIHRPGSYYINDIFAGSESLWEWFYKVNGRLDFDPVRLEGTWTKGKSTNKAADLTRDVETLNGKAMISLGFLSKSLGNLYVGVFAHRFKSTDLKMPFEDYYVGPLAVLEIPLSAHRK